MMTAQVVLACCAVGGNQALAAEKGLTLKATDVKLNKDTISLTLVLSSKSPRKVFLADRSFRFQFQSGKRTFHAVRHIVSLPYDPKKVAALASGKTVTTTEKGVRHAIVIPIPEVAVDDQGQIKFLKRESVDRLRIELRGYSSFWDGKKVIQKQGLWEGTVRLDLPFPAKRDQADPK